jgi:hypothetical protein
VLSDIYIYIYMLIVRNYSYSRHHETIGYFLTLRQIEAMVIAGSVFSPELKRR